MKKVFEPVSIGGMELKNRLVRSATWEGIADPDGSITEEALGIYEELAKGGVGAIITGFTSVALHDYNFDGMMRLCDDALIPQYKRLTDIIHEENCPVITQLALGGYYREAGGEYRLTEPDRMTAEEIGHVVRLFIEAAVRAEKAGFDGVQIHIAHYFFLSRFISPALNHRCDEYGGSVAARARIITEIIEGIRAAAPTLHITAKINCSDFVKGGLQEAECVETCCIMDAAGIDSIEISGNGTSVGGIKAHVNEGYFADAAAAVAHRVSCPVMVVGGFRSLEKMESVLNGSDIELISISRPLLREPDFPKILEKDPDAVSKCVSCNGCYSSPGHRCVFRGREQR
ncbi:MAG: NADH:flavin oxidoreductase [Oscillospiraceae bacterium]|nr:NADH:flavin oxidoreductase [Oscillospiraceae bacterium]